MKQLVIKDNSRTLCDSFSSVSRITEKIADKTTEQLEKDGIFIFPESVLQSDDISGDQIVLQKINNSFVSGNIMGYLGCGDERLIIRSRFTDGENDYFFQYLLQHVMGIPNIVDMKTDSSHESSYLNILMFLFPYYLKNAVRKGIFKTYIKNEYNDISVKGTIDIPRHIRNNVPFIGNIAYSTRDHSYDNELTELIRHTIEFLKSKPYGNLIFSKIKVEVKLIVNATPSYEQCDRQKIILLNKEKSVRHAYFREYRMLQQLCIQILQHQNTQYGYGTRLIHGILFDGAWLWEEYINTLIHDDFYHPSNKSSEGHQWLFSNSTGKVYPDFIGRDPENRIIADAKYKPMKNISAGDYHQILAYMFRFDAKKGLFLYPEAEEAQNTILWMNRGVSFEKNVTARSDVCVLKQGLRLPKDAGNYDEFVSRLKENEKIFIKSIM